MGNSTKPFKFRPERIAYYEAHGWRAYYDRDWLKLLGLIVNLCQEQFHIPFPVSLLAAYHITRASIAWAPVDHDINKVHSYYEAFYRLARRFSGLEFDPTKAAFYETEYNEVHRRLVGQADKSEFIQAMAMLHSSIFGLTIEQALPSAVLRVQANNTVDLITGKTSSDPEADWKQLQRYLEQCYTSIQQEMDKNRALINGSQRADRSRITDQPL